MASPRMSSEIEDISHPLTDLRGVDRAVAPFLWRDESRV